MALVLVGVLLIALGLAGAVGIGLAGALDFGTPWFSWAAPIAILGGFWTQKGRRRLAVVPTAVALALLMNHEQLRLGSWSGVIVCACGAIVLALGVQSRTPEDKAKDRRLFIFVFVAAILALAGLYLVPMILR
jgi:hypothetical protein